MVPTSPACSREQCTYDGCGAVHNTTGRRKRVNAMQQAHCSQTCIVLHLPCVAANQGCKLAGSPLPPYVFIGAGLACLGSGQFVQAFSMASNGASKVFSSMLLFGASTAFDRTFVIPSCHVCNLVRPCQSRCVPLSPSVSCSPVSWLVPSSL